MFHPQQTPLGVAPGGTFLDTIAQLSPTAERTYLQQLSDHLKRERNAAIRAGLLPDTHEARHAWYRRAHARALSVAIASKLVELGGPFSKKYHATLSCCNSVMIHYRADDWSTFPAQREEQKEKAKHKTLFCKQRWCVVCARNNVGKFLSQYTAQIEAMEEPHFVTLTLRNVKADELRSTFAEMVAANRAAVNGRTGRLFKIKGLRKIECTYSQKRDDFHPHLHLIVDTWAAAQWLRDSWLARWGERAHMAAQDVRPVTLGEDGAGAKELMKYYAKMFDFKRDGAGKKVEYSRGLNATDVKRKKIEALDVMYQAMHRYRQLQPFGGVRAAKREKTARWSLEEMQNAVVYHWSDALRNWVEPDTSDALGGLKTRKITPLEHHLALVAAMCEVRRPKHP